MDVLPFHSLLVLMERYPLLDNEAKRVIEMSPAWTPGKMGGKPVPVTYTFPVIYKLN